MNQKAIHRPTVDIKAVRSANVTRCIPAYTSHSSDVHRLFINWHVQDGYV